MTMKQVKLTEPSFVMLKELSKRKDSLGLQAYLEELIMIQYKNKK